MGDAMSRGCDNCWKHGMCGGMSFGGNCIQHQFPEEKFNSVDDNKPKVTFVDKIKDYEFKPGMINYPDSKPKTFSLDKLIDDHWGYVDEVINYTLGSNLDGFSKDEFINAVCFHYKSAFRHGYKHALERHNIKEPTNE